MSSFKNINPLFSIIIANYNSENYIQKTLDSLNEQTENHLEIVIVDDGSTDNSVDIIRQFIKDKPNFNLVVNEINLGGGGSKKKGIALATGEIMGFVDCDDYLHHQAVEKMKEAHVRYDECGLIYSDAYLVDGKNNIKGLLRRSEKLAEGETILEKDCAFHFATWKRHYYEKCDTGFNEMFNVAYDLDLYYKLEEVGRVHFIETPLYYYRVHGNNLSMGFNRLGRSITELLIAKYEAHKRRENVDISGLADLLQSNFVSVKTRTLKSISAKQILKDRFKNKIKKLI
jgi:glycosyltransferase involved in cell wall biosynthesis